MRGIWFAVALTAGAMLCGCGDETKPDPSGGNGGDGAGAAGGTGGDGGAGGIVPPNVMACGPPAPSMAATCPGECTGGCADGVCNIQCSAVGDCNTIVACPQGMDCQVTCSGMGSCPFKIDCPDYYQCNVGCTGPSACVGAEINCGIIGNCNVICALTDACNNANINCDSGKCETICVGPMSNPTIDCGSSCDCTTCM